MSPHKHREIEQEQTETKEKETDKQNDKHKINKQKIEYNRCVKLILGIGKESLSRHGLKEKYYCYIVFLLLIVVTNEKTSSFYRESSKLSDKINNGLNSEPTVLKKKWPNIWGLQRKMTKNMWSVEKEEKRRKSKRFYKD